MKSERSLIALCIAISFLIAFFGFFTIIGHAQQFDNAVSVPELTSLKNNLSDAGLYSIKYDLVYKGIVFNHSDAGLTKITWINGASKILLAVNVINKYVAVPLEKVNSTYYTGKLVYEGGEIQTFKLYTSGTSLIFEFPHFTSVCLGCAIGTYQATYTGLVNQSWINLSSPINVTSGTINFTGIPVYGLWNSSYIYQQQTTVNNPNATIIYLKLHNESGTSNATDVYGSFIFNLTSNTVNSTHFILNNASELPFMTNNIIGNVANITVNVSTVQAGDKVTLYFTNLTDYGSANNITHTYLFFDPCNDLSQWTVTGSPIIESGTCRIGGANTWNTNGMYSNRYFNDSNATGMIFKLNSKTVPGGLNIIRWYFGWSNWTNPYALGIGTFPEFDLRQASYIENTVNYSIYSYVDNIWMSNTIIVKPGVGFNEYLDDNLMFDNNTWYPSPALTKPQRIVIQAITTQNHYFDNITVIKMTSPMPTWNNWTVVPQSSNFYVQPQNHPVSENKTTNASFVSLNLSITPGNLFQNTQVFINTSITVNATLNLVVSDNVTINSESICANLLYCNNISFTPILNLTNITITVPITNTTFKNSATQGNITTNGTIQNSSWSKWNISINVSNVTGGQTYWYNNTIPFTEPPQTTYDIVGYVNNTLGAFVDGALVKIDNASALSRTTYLRNNTDLCNFNQSSMLCDGTRQTGVNYTTLEEIQLIVMAHANSISQTADITVNIDGVNVTRSSGRPLGAPPEESYKQTVIVVPKYSKYAVHFSNYHHFEWREYPLVHGYYNLTSINGTQTVLAQQVGYANFTGSLNVNANKTYNITLSEKDAVSEDTVIDYSMIAAIIGGLLAFVLLRRKKKEKYISN